MKTFGWIFLAGYTLDAVLSLISLYVPGILLASNLLSSVMVALTVIAFVLAVWGKLAPRMLFVSLCGYYFLVMMIGVALSTLLLIKLGPEKLQGTEISPQFLRQQYPWFGPVHLALIIAWLVLGAYGLATYGRNLGGAKVDALPIHGRK